MKWFKSQYVLSILVCSHVLFSPLAMARPGTPNELKGSVGQNNQFCFSFKNTATEPVVFDLEFSPAGSTSRLFSKSRSCQFDSACKRLFERRDPFFHRGQLITLCTDPLSVQTHRICMRAIAREWNNGDPQSGHVSDEWSAWGCATKPAK
jgi:hypothetical protein